MPKALLDAIDKQAEVEFRNRSDLIREAARAYITQKGGMNLENRLTKTEESRIKNSFEFANFSSEPAISISCAYRPQPNNVKDIFTAGSTAMKLVENPPKLRDVGGWGLETLDRARPVAGEYLEVNNGKHKLLRLYRDGQHTFSAGMKFFGHAVNQNIEYPIKFNLLSVAELITNFVSFSYAMGETLEKEGSILIFTIAVSNPRAVGKYEDANLTLAAYDGIGVENRGELNLDWAERTITVRAEDGVTKERAAYLIYSEFCYFFGVRSDELWYITKNQEIDKEVFVRGGR